MKRRFVLVLGIVLAASIVVAGCAASAPAPQPQATAAAPAAPTKAAEPTKASVAAPTAAPAPAPTKSATYPVKGKPITVMVPYAAGGGTDLIARLVAGMLEKELGATFTVVNRTDGGGSVAAADVAKAAPDGYTLGAFAIPTIIPLYLDPDRGATFSRKDFQPVAIFTSSTFTFTVPADSPFKNLKDVIDAAKAKPDTVTVANVGLMTTGHFAFYRLEKAAGVRFAMVNTGGTAPALNALLGGHVQAAVIGPEILPHVQAGKLRVLGIINEEEYFAYPGIKTAKAQGYDAAASNMIGYIAPAGLSKDALDVLSAGIKKISATEEFRAKMKDMAFASGYVGPEEFAARWAQMEPDAKAMIDEAKSRK